MINEIDLPYEVYKFKLKGIFNIIVNYSYVILDKFTKNAVVVDPAWDLQQIIELLNNHKMKLKAVLLTHHHFDHTNLVDKFIDLFGAQVFMSKQESSFYNFNCSNLITVDDLDVIELGETKISCLVTPGHTAGGTCYLIEDSLFTGDTIFIEGCGMCTEEGGSASQMFDSIQRIKGTISHEAKIYPGHSYGKEPGQTLEYLMQENIYFHFNERELFIKFRMRENQKGII